MTVPLSSGAVPEKLVVRVEVAFAPGAQVSDSFGSFTAVEGEGLVGSVNELPNLLKVMREKAFEELGTGIEAFRAFESAVGTDTGMSVVPLEDRDGTGRSTARRL